MTRVALINCVDIPIITTFSTVLMAKKSKVSNISQPHRTRKILIGALVLIAIICLGLLLMARAERFLALQQGGSTQFLHALHDCADRSARLMAYKQYVMRESIRNPLSPHIEVSVRSSIKSDKAASDMFTCAVSNSDVPVTLNFVKE